MTAFEQPKHVCSHPVRTLQSLQKKHLCMTSDQPRRKAGKFEMGLEGELQCSVCDLTGGPWLDWCMELGLRVGCPEV